MSPRPARRTSDERGSFRPGLARWDQDEFTSFYARHFADLVRYLRPVSGEDAMDDAQTAMLRLADHWNEVENKLGWVFTVARRLGLNRLTAIRREEPLSAAVDHLDQASDDNVEDTVVKVDVAQLFARLPVRQRAVMAMTFSGSSTEEISKRLDVTVSTVRNLKAQARRNLREVLDAEGWEAV